MLLIAVTAGLCLSSCRMIREEPRAGDEAVRLLLKEMKSRQPEPYGLPDNSTFNYIWAQYMCAFLAAERCGYLPREEALARLKGMLNAIEPLERHHGFSYDGYDLATGRKTTDKIYFQGWWLFTLAILKNAYPELAESCQRMLDEVDYERSGLFNPDTRQLAADYFTDDRRVSFWIDLYWQPTGEFRSPYVAYSYITGDLSPWTRHATPRMVDVEGFPVLGVWHNFFFCSMLMHSVFPDLGYLARSWDELLNAMNAYRARNGMTFYPTRAEPLELWKEVEPDAWPNTEHRIAKPWLAWFGDPDAPVMQKAFSPGAGITLYADNMNFYWSYGSNLSACAETVGTDAENSQREGRWELFFMAFPLPGDIEPATPVRLKSLKLFASCDRGALQPRAPLVVALNGVRIAEVQPERLGEEPTPVLLEWDRVVLTNDEHVLTFSTAETEPGRGYRLYRYENDLWKGTYRFKTSADEAMEKQVAPPYAEIVLEGQYRGGENPYALLARCAVVHGYYPWHELLDDERFLETTVVWVGDYARQARIGRVVHNVSDAAVDVEYERPAAWRLEQAIRVFDITEGGENAVSVSADEGRILWRAEPRHTYRLAYAPRLEQPSGQNN